jgi:hypothetical protein
MPHKDVVQMPRPIRTLALVIASLIALTAQPSRGADAELFPDRCAASVDGKDCQLRRTGIAVRYRSAFKVYVVASYIQEGAKATNAEELLASNDVKQLRLHFLIGVSGEEMGQSFRKSLRGNHPEPEFDAEVARLLDLLEKTSVKRGENLVLTHLPAVGLHCKRQGGEEFVIANVEFSRAIWENYLGKVNSGDDVKQGLVSELP